MLESLLNEVADLKVFSVKVFLVKVFSLKSHSVIGHFNKFQEKIVWSNWKSGWS